MVFYILIFIAFIIATILGLYFFHIFIAPRKIEEIARMIDAGQTGLAIKRLTEALEKDDRDFYAHYLLAEAYKKEGNIQFAILEYRQVLKLGKYNEKVTEVNIRDKLAAIYKERNAIEEARKEYLILTQIDPLNYQNFFELGVIFYNNGMFDKAISYLKKSAVLNRNHDQTFYYIGQTMYRLANYQEAKQALAEAIRIDQGNYKAHYFFGLVLRQLGDYEWAIKEFEVAGKSDELRVKCYLAKGTCYTERDQFPKAILEFEKGLKYARKGSDSELNLRYFLADAQEKMRDLYSAITNWEMISKVKKSFKDVPAKLKLYADFRQDDNVKDFLIAGLAQFEILSRKLVEVMGFNISEIEIDEMEVEIIAIEPEGRFRNLRRGSRLIKIIRNTDMINDTLLRKLHETMKTKSANRVMIIAAGEFSQSAIEFANTRPIDLLGKTELVSLLKKIKK